MDKAAALATLLSAVFRTKQNSLPIALVSQSFIDDCLLCSSIVPPCKQPMFLDRDASRTVPVQSLTCSDFKADVCVATGAGLFNYLRSHSRPSFKQKHKSKLAEGKKFEQTGETQLGKEGAKGIRRCSQPRGGSLNLEANCWKMGPWLCFCWLFSELIFIMQNRRFEMILKVNLNMIFMLRNKSKIYDLKSISTSFGKLIRINSRCSG